MFVAIKSGSRALNAVNSSTTRCSDGRRLSQSISTHLLSQAVLFCLAKKSSLSESLDIAELLLFSWLLSSSVTTFSKIFSFPKQIKQTLSLSMQCTQNLMRILKRLVLVYMYLWHCKNYLLASVCH